MKSTIDADQAVAVGLFNTVDQVLAPVALHCTVDAAVQVPSALATADMMLLQDAVDTTGQVISYNPMEFIVWTGEHFVAVEPGVYLHV